MPNATGDSNGSTVDTSTAHPARRYNYWLGGKDNFAADRESADAIEAVFPHIRTAAVENRRFLQRVVRVLTQEHGIRQFLDVGTGLPTADNTHQVAQRIEPSSRVVYVDNDPLVLTHARALLTSAPEGRTAYISADLRDPESILAHADLVATLDLSRPVAVMLIAVLHFVHDDDQADKAIATLMGALPPGSFLALTHATADFLPPEIAAALTSGKVRGASSFEGRSGAQVARLLDGNGLELIEPGLTVVSQWRPDPDVTPPPAEHVSVYGAVARKL
ncbi:SAM-dependent methyltransferase [Paractinoplanes hotanensis]|uniref:SAM-dependent methyltransferase n=1 Tax=Paractinoplanes hotanensis TaxID=2906497 RepID=A0ABT0XRU6_9ACTN|nr:SAM-dependent methyltransferase [Actinoplanes hotanensis]MCM4075978.1 SAM-dependent methyltransferase [Actinoplanes hotanensis]